MSIKDFFTLDFSMSIAAIDEWEKFLDENLDLKLIIFIGRSNVGKSSLINLLFNKKIAFTSQKPGKTRLINIFKITDPKKPNATLGALIDLPGYGFAHVSKEERAKWDQLLGDFFHTLDLNSHLFCLQDSRHPFSSMDLIMLDFLRTLPIERTLILTKMDQCKTQKDKNDLKRILDLNTSNYHFEQMHYVSKEDWKELIKLQNHIKHLLFAK